MLLVSEIKIREKKKGDKKRETRGGDNGKMEIEESIILVI
jgi:hypothetical protein